MNEKINQNITNLKRVIDHLENALEGREECNIDNWQINIKAAALAFNKIDLCSLEKCQGTGNEISQKLQAALSECAKYANEGPASDQHSLEDYHEVLNIIESHVQSAISKTQDLHTVCLAEKKTQDGPSR